jgi:hypothetical protein
MPYDPPGQSTLEGSARMRSSWFVWVLAVPPTLAALITLVVQSRSKWALLRRIHGWPGVKQTLTAVAWAMARWEFRRLPTIARRRSRQPPPTPPS